jgi:hypothetical protein
VCTLIVDLESVNKKYKYGQKERRVNVIFGIQRVNMNLMDYIFIPTSNSPYSLSFSLSGTFSMVDVNRRIINGLPVAGCL